MNQMQHSPIVATETPITNLQNKRTTPLKHFDQRPASLSMKRQGTTAPGGESANTGEN